MSSPRIRSQDGRWIDLAESPSVNATNEWLLELGCRKSVVGKTVQGRDMNLYWMDYPLPSSSVASNSSVLFLSLVHGNEPMGLVSLLMGAKELATPPFHEAKGLRKPASMRIYFFPIVNVDAYELNLAREGEPGCWRPNLRPTCESGSKKNIFPTASNDNTTEYLSPVALPCHYDPGQGGVDLNRNFPTDWTRNDLAKCSYTYPGPHPLSEPETQAIAAVVENHNITHAMSLHSRSTPHVRALIIHPYTSTRSFETMDKEDAKRFREWGLKMNEKLNYYYTVGTAEESIRYTAGGTTIDWMYTEKHVVSFVLEVLPPCDGRWCQGQGVYQSAGLSAATMVNFVTLVTGDQNDSESFHVFLFLSLVLLLAGAIYSITSFRHNCRLLLHRFALPNLRKGYDPTETVELKG